MILKLTIPTGFDTDAEYSDKWPEIDAWFEANQHVYDAFVKSCRDWIAWSGDTRWAVGAAWERMRWTLKVRTTDNDYALNDHYRPYMVRLATAQEKDLEGMFEQRRADADGWLKWHQNGSRPQHHVVTIAMGRAA